MIRALAQAAQVARQLARNNQLKAVVVVVDKLWHPILNKRLPLSLLNLHQANRVRRRFHAALRRRKKSR
jgi:hypothetical protein